MVTVTREENTLSWGMYTLVFLSKKCMEPVYIFIILQNPLTEYQFPQEKLSVKIGLKPVAWYLITIFLGAIFIFL